MKSLSMTIRKVLLSPDHTVFAYNTEREGMEYGDLRLKSLDGKRQVRWEEESRYQDGPVRKSKNRRMKLFMTFSTLSGRITTRYATP